MAEIHIPPEVVEAGAKAAHQIVWPGYDWDEITGPGRQQWREIARATLTAALAEWVKCGMAQYAPAQQGVPQTLIIRTEAL